MTKQKYKYAITILVIIVLGLLSRRTTVLPAATGDALYAAMMYFIVRFFMVRHKIKKIAIISLVICFMIECSQLYQVAWINNIRTTLPGRLILGQGFLWSDLLAYVSGVVIASLTDIVLKRNK
ncbi:DUF2809 domain-containing protein [Taibaiella lutea]|uniref:DUF2809 domain-containing protein n=1 Tax=Taibaiella lutea TaxID=2608001 RepID=A0A5M6CGF7_9BACT|nr:DUF2809 domain-containing protein [Taibaiella lutea]KAA5533520.1 DUF2809 domain-containing protein [Taibaiella lutea]